MKGIRGRRPIRAMPWATDTRRWPLVRAPSRPRVVSSRRVARSDPAWLAAVLFVLAAALAGFTLLRGIDPHDEGLVLQAAARMADGQWPYADFWWSQGPGQPAVLALGFELFGSSLLPWRILRVAVGALVAVLAYRLVRREASRGWALAAWAGAAGAMAWPVGPGPNASALALGLGAILLAGRTPVGGGALAGLAVAFRPEIGLAAAAGAALGARRPGAGRAALAAVGTGVACLVPFFVVAPGEMADQTLGFLGIQDLQRLPFPLDYDGPLDLDGLLEFYFPLVLVAGAGLWALATALQRPPRRELAVAPLAVAGVLYLLARTDQLHLVPLSVALSVLLALAAARSRSLPWKAALAAALALVVVHGIERRAGDAAHPPELAPLRLDPADGVRVAPGDARTLERLRAYVDRRAPRGAPVFVANPRHDLVRVGNPLLYVLLERSNPTRYDVMQPGVVTTAAVQREMVADLERARPPVVVRWLDPTAARAEPNGAGRSSGVRVLDTYLGRRYRAVERFGPYQVLARRPASQSAP